MALRLAGTDVCSENRDVRAGHVPSGAVTLSRAGNGVRALRAPGGGEGRLRLSASSGKGSRRWPARSAPITQPGFPEGSEPEPAGCGVGLESPRRKKGGSLQGGRSLGGHAASFTCLQAQPSPGWPTPSPPFPEPTAPPKGTSPSPPGTSGQAASGALPTPQQADSRHSLQQEVLPRARSPSGSSHLQEPVTWIFRIVLSIFSRLLNGALPARSFQGAGAGSGAAGSSRCLCGTAFSCACP